MVVHQYSKVISSLREDLKKRDEYIDQLLEVCLTLSKQNQELRRNQLLNLGAENAP